MIDSDFFKGRRQALMEQLEGGVAVLTAYRPYQMVADMAGPFRQEPNFWYLSGIDEPDWRIIIDGQRGYCWAVMPTRDPVQVVFEGGMTAQQAQQRSGVDEVIDADTAQKILKGFIKNDNVIHTLSKQKDYYQALFALNPAIDTLVAELTELGAKPRDCQSILTALRTIKQPEELAAIRKAVAITTAAFDDVHKTLSELATEYAIDAQLGHHFRERGARHAYPPIVAAGGHACTLHYDVNQGKVRPGDMVLIDAGARVDGYSADITRTYARGSISARAQAVHQAVRSAHHDILGLIQPGRSLREYQQQVDERMLAAMRELGLVTSSRDDAAYRRYFPHAIGHGLGVAVHDDIAALYDQFAPGMVLTVEPGIYLPEEAIGVRIEDDVVVTDDGCEVLSAGLATGH